MEHNTTHGTVHTGAHVVHEGHDGHNGDGHHHHKETFITKYIFSQDHKMIAKQFLATGMIWAVIGGLFSVLFRLQLGYPDQTFPILETFFGHWARGGKIDPEFYYALVTMHGTIMVFFVLTGGLSGTFANLLIPLQAGARDMASPFMNMLSYWFFFLASVVMTASLFVETGPASGGWTSYPPLSALGQASSGSKIGMDLWITSMALFVVSSLLGGLNYVSTILNLRTKGMSMTRLPLTVWALFFTAILGILSFPVLLSGFILLLFDHNHWNPNHCNTTNRRPKTRVAIRSMRYCCMWRCLNARIAICMLRLLASITMVEYQNAAGVSTTSQFAVLLFTIYALVRPANIMMMLLMATQRVNLWGCILLPLSLPPGGASSECFNLISVNIVIFFLLP